jgi:hypothetical protein
MCIYIERERGRERERESIYVSRFLSLCGNDFFKSVLHVLSLGSPEIEESTNSTSTDLGTNQQIPLKIPAM